MGTAGLIDELILQVYRDDLNIFINELELPEGSAASYSSECRHFNRV